MANFTIGRDNASGTARGYIGNTELTRFNVIDVRTTAANEYLREIGMYFDNDGSGSTTKTVAVGVRRADTGAILYQTTLSTSSSAGNWIRATGLNVLLPAGVEIQVGFSSSVTGTVAVFQTASTNNFRLATTGVNVISDPSIVTGAFDSRRFCLYANTETTAPSQSITDINSGGDVSGDTSGNTFSTTGFTESITDITVGALDCTDVVDTSGSGTFTVPPPVHLSTYPEIGVNQDVVISGATESATLAKPFVLNGYTRTPLVDPEIVDLTYPTAHFDVPPITDDLMINVTADLTPSADGGITTGAPKTTIIMHWVRSTAVMYIYSFVINGGGVVSAGGLVSPGLFSRGLVTRGLVARGL